MDALIDVSRLQFAFTALTHFLFVPLTLGLSLMLVTMESLYVITNKQIYKDMTRFWGKLFAINFAMGVVTGLTMEFQFGTNWAYYSHYVGDIFGVPLAIEGMMAFFLESTFVGLFFFGWDRLSKGKHLMVTSLVAFGSNLSALWILIANGWMQHPVGMTFNPDTMRTELSSFSELLFNPVAQVKFLHTLSAGYLTGAVFVLAISAWYMLRGRDLEFARRSFAVAAGFGLVVSVSAIMLGDESGYHVAEYQPEKMAAIEAEWETEPAPAAFTVVGFPDEATKTTHMAIQIPGALGLIGTRSLDKQVPGVVNLIEENEGRIRDGMIAWSALREMRKGDKSDETRALFDAHQDNLGHALLLKKYTDDVATASDEQIQQAARDTVPAVAPMFWTFRIMVAIGMGLFLLMLWSFIAARKGGLEQRRGLLWIALLALPLPWVAAELGWFVAEFGRQPWTIYGILPTHLSASSLSFDEVKNSLIAFALMYSSLFAVEMFLMVKYARLGPSSLHTGRYHFES
ncbi:cytochrome bd-I ubiquinol oxidase subunit CydA [Mariprofundus erugo]|uniref:Cytochrome bd-I ubiquinol oxidase subunit CydA n=1 Tax=Mariprofundus erugo TaxID=2528639 RepID=A0A5R9GJZ6_9PROT|nr:cytochrome ubiquinol oxidase subunit I [Mariprofundus erugo]TLS66128.1 cytochrome bd-I ubiquinol oxidase subunit CydA [Mariprofundus erugo]TLS75614.1 cytochrome bd-I ubiquinol oxidase subunit CydA [Mariprofundus erugo]